MQTILDDLNKIKCSFFVASQLKQVKSKTTSGDQLREKIQKWLSPPDPSINQYAAYEARHNGTATWFLEGSIYDEWKEAGSLLWTHGNRMVFYSLPTPVTDGFSSGIWQEHSLVGEISDEFVDVAYIGDQLIDHKGHRIHPCDRIGFSRILLLRFQGH